MTGFRRRNRPLDAYSSVTCGAFHPIPFLIPTADLRTMGPQAQYFIFISIPKNDMDVNEDRNYHGRIKYNISKLIWCRDEKRVRGDLTNYGKESMISIRT